MKKDSEYLTISEFGGLRNVSSKLLRYYERVGALFPAYVDPETQYRYYTIDQLADLDTLLLCLEMDIPLKEANKYRDANGMLMVEKLFEDGTKRITEKAKRYEDILLRLNCSIAKIREEAVYKDCDTFYTRRIRRRFILKEPLGEAEDPIGFSRHSVSIFRKAHQLGLAPIYAFPVGVIFERTKSPRVSKSIFLEIISPGKEMADVQELEEREYLCRQETRFQLCESDQVYEEMASVSERAQTILMTHIAQDYYYQNTFPIEVQIQLSAETKSDTAAQGES